MKPLMLAAALAAAATLSACGTAASTGATTTPAARPAAAVTHQAAPLTCKQRSDAWKKASHPRLTRFKRALTPFTAGTVTSRQAHRLTRAARAALDAPPPGCADPKGYYQQALAQIETAASAAEGGGALSELGALTPLESANTDLELLGAELHRTIGSGKL